MKLSQKIQETNPIKYANPRNTKESGCQNLKKIYAYHHSLPGRWQTSIDQKNHAGTYDCAHCKIHNPLQHPFFHGLLSFAISFDYCIIFLKPCRYVWYFPESFFQNFGSLIPWFVFHGRCTYTNHLFTVLQFNRHDPFCPMVRMIPYPGCIKHPHGRLYRSRSVVFIAVIDHFFDPALDDCLGTFIAREQWYI